MSYYSRTGKLLYGLFCLNPVTFDNHIKIKAFDFQQTKTSTVQKERNKKIIRLGLSIILLLHFFFYKKIFFKKMSLKSPKTLRNY